jgi:hypothetical protein
LAEKDRNIYKDDLVPLFWVSARVLIGIVGLVLVLFFVLVIALNLQPVQQFAANKATDWLSQTLQTKVRIGKVKIDPIKTIVLENIYLEDQQQDTLVYAGALSVDIGLFALSTQTININSIELHDAYVNVYRPEKAEKFNYEFIPEAFASDTTAKDTSSSQWDFDLETINLVNSRVAFADHPENMFLTFSLKELLAEINTLGLENMHSKVDLVRFDHMALTFQHDKVLDVDGDTVKIDTTQQAIEDFGFALDLNKLEILNSNISYNAVNMPEVERGIDYNHLNVTALNFAIQDVKIEDKSLYADLNQLAFRDQQSGFVLEKFALTLESELPALNVTLNELRTPNSSFFEQVSIDVANVNKIDEIVSTVNIKADFSSDSIAVEDVRFFTDVLDTLPALHGSKVYLSGDLLYQNEVVNWQNMDLRLDDQNYISGSVLAKNVTNPDKLFFDVDISDASSSTGFINKFLPPGTLAPEFRTVGPLRLKAKAKGTTDNLTADVRLDTDAGNITADASVRTDAAGRMHFAGDAGIENVVLSRFLGAETGLGAVTMSTTAQGYYSENDIRVDSAEVYINNLVYNGYTYTGLKASGTYINEYANVALHYNDANLQTDLLARADLKTDSPLILLNATIDRADLRRLNLIEDTIVLQTNLIADFKGSSAENMKGRLQADYINMQRGKYTYNIDTVSVTALSDSTFKQFRFLSDFMQAYVAGNFTFQELPKAIDLFIKEYFTKYEVDTIPLKNPQDFSFYVSIDKNPALMRAFVPDLSIPEPLKVQGSFRSKDKFAFLAMEAPTVIYGENRIDGINFAADTYNDSLLFFTSINGLFSNDSLLISNVALSSSVQQDGLKFAFSVSEKTAPSRLRLKGELASKGDTINLALRESEIIVKNQAWVLDSTAFVAYAPDYLNIRNFVLENEEQRLAINTSPLPGGRIELIAEFLHLQVEDLYAMTGMNDFTLGGVVNGRVDVADVFNPQTIESNLRVSAFEIDSVLVGDIFLLADKSNANSIVRVKGGIEGAANEVLLAGMYDLADTNGTLNFDVTVQQLLLEQFAPLVKDQLAQLKGNLAANMQVRGTINQPLLNGEILFRGQHIVEPVMTGVPLTITNQRIIFDQDRLILNKFTIIDDRRKVARLDGNITFAELTNPILDLRFTANGFHVLDNNQYISPMVYGDMVINEANATITGTAANTVIDGDIKIGEGNSLALNVADQRSDVLRADYIIMYDGTEPASLQKALSSEEDSLRNSGVTGITLNSRITVTSDAEMKIIIDEQNGDNLTIAGDAYLTFRMNPQGDINMVGTYTVDRGRYELNLFGAIKREFGIQEGSTITWYGSPTDAEMNITAVYQVEVPYYPLIADRLEGMPVSTEEMNASRSPLPVDVLLTMKGELFKPELSFDIEPDARVGGTVGDVFNTKINEIKQVETELNKQVFALVALNRFLDTPGTQAGTTGAQAVNRQIDQTVSQFLNQQLNNLSQDYLGGVEINVDIESRRDAEGAYGTGLEDRVANLSLTRELFNDRISVTVGSSINVGGQSAPTEGAAGAQNSGGTASSIIGDFTVEYRFVKSGNLVLRFFRRNNRNDAVVVGNESERIGISLNHRKNFDHIRDLFERPIAP